MRLMIGLTWAALAACVCTSAPSARADDIPAEPGQPPPKELKYRRGKPIPPGYHVEERSRDGMVVAGAVLFALPFAGGIVAAVASQGQNETGWLYAPLIGPWFTLGLRRYTGACGRTSASDSDSMQCLDDIFVVMGLITDGLLQITGGTLMLVGNFVSKKVLVRDDAALRVVPMQVGSGYGLGVRAGFSARNRCDTLRQCGEPRGRTPARPPNAPKREYRNALPFLRPSTCSSTQGSRTSSSPPRR
jgi:hypothetical protein